MNKQTEAMKLALEALEEITDEVFSPYDNKLGEAIIALREALAKPDFWEGYIPEPVKPAPVQEPVGVKFNEGLWQEREARITQLEDELMRMQGRELKLQFALAEQPAQQEPMAWFNPENFTRTASQKTEIEYAPLYTSPPAQRTWVGLTDEEMFEAIRQLYSSDKVARLAVSHSKDEYRAIEAKLKEKNNG